MRPTAILIPAIAALALAPTTHAQCDGTWLPWPTTGNQVLNGTASALCEWDPDGSGPGPSLVYVGGEFSQAGNVPGTQFIAAWDGLNWHPVGSSLSNRADDLLVFENRLVAVGPFTYAEEKLAYHVAAWDGTHWQAMGAIDGQATCLGTYKGELVAGSWGYPTSRCITKWNGSEWVPLGGGISSSPNDAVFCLAQYNGELYAGGKFTSIDSLTVNHIARWDGSSWHALGSGVTNASGADVRTLKVIDGTLYIGGAFPGIGGASLPKYCAYWDGSSWSSSIVAVNGPVNAITEYNGELVIGGWFTTVNGLSIKGIARRIGMEWNGLSTGLTGSPINSAFEMLRTNSGELMTVGAFTFSGPYNNRCVARWTPTGIPTIAAHPQPLTINPTDTATFTTTPTYGYASLSTLSYQWHRNNQRLDDDNRITGATTPTLTITSAQPSDAGDYTCAITNTCGTITTNPATLTINTPPPPCPGDTNADNLINGADLSVLLSNFGNTVPPGTAADFNNDAIINGADLSVLLSNFGASCP